MRTDESCSLHLIVDPTCSRQRNKARDERMARLDASRRASRTRGVMTFDDEGEIEANVKELPEYPSRPHCSFNE